MIDVSFTTALVVAATIVGTVSLAAGMLLVQQRKARGPPHPFTSAFVSGLLIGISCLVVLPTALEQLPSAGWKVSQVLVLFLGSAALMFFLDHSVMEHHHVARGERIPQRSVDSSRARHELLPSESGDRGAEPDPSVWKAKEDEIPVWARPSTAGRDELETDYITPATAEVMSRTETSVDTVEPSSTTVPSTEPKPLPHAPVAWCPCHGGDPFEKGLKVFKISFSGKPAQRGQVCPNIVASPPPSPPPSPPVHSAPDTLENGGALMEIGTGTQGQSATGLHTITIIVRVCAWMLHAMLDGMVLASAPSTYTLIATAPAITLCALQDVTAFTVTIARLGVDSQCSLTSAVVAISCAFPIGALVSHAILDSTTSKTTVNIVRTVVAGIFTYMALFEVAPPHTHSRVANMCYLLCFLSGAATAYLVEAIA